MDIKKYNKYKNDKKSFSEKFLYVHDYISGKKSNPKLFGWQNEILDSNENLLILKPRNVGVSTSFVFDIVNNLNFQKDHKMLVVSPNDSMLKELLHLVRYNLTHLPVTISVGLNKNLKYSITSNIGSDAIFRCGSNTMGRGYTFDSIYIDEADGIKNFEDVFVSLMPCLSLNKGKIFISSTPMNNSYFYKLWNSNNTFSKLSINAPSSYTYNGENSNVLNSITKEMYDKIVDECII